MTTEIKIELFVMAVISSVVAVTIIFFILKKMGRINPDVGRVQDEALAAKLRADHPGFARLPTQQQLASVRKVRTHPLIWIFVLALLGAFIWTALSVPTLLDWINQGARSASVVGIAVLAVVLGGIAMIRRLLIARLLAKLR